MNGQWVKFYEYANHDSSVNSVCWAPHDFGLILACGSSDGSISILSATAAGGWEAKKINNAHTVPITLLLSCGKIFLFIYLNLDWLQCC